MRTMHNLPSSKRTSTEFNVETDGNSVSILGVRIDSTSKQQVLSRVQQAVEKRSKLFIVTPNPEIVLQATYDFGLKEALNSSDISLCDGFGLVLAEKYLRSRRGEKSGVIRKLEKLRHGRLHVMKGREMVMLFLELAQYNKARVMLVGDRRGSARAAERVLRAQFKDIKLYSIEGPNLTLSGEPSTMEDTVVEKNAITKINDILPEFLFVGFGAPRQEKWLSKWLPRLQCNVAMVVGGTFDYVSGKAKLPPGWWPGSLEWTWRLFTQMRFRRVWNAVVVFPFKIVFSKF